MLGWYWPLAGDPSADCRWLQAEHLRQRTCPADNVPRLGDWNHAANNKALPNLSQEAFPHPGLVVLNLGMTRQLGEHLGHKLRRAMTAKDVKQAAVAQAFGVRPPTVSGDWLKHGRIAKKHYPRLVEYFGLPYEWWFGNVGADPQIEAVMLLMVSMSKEQKDQIARAALRTKQPEHQRQGRKAA